MNTTILLVAIFATLSSAHLVKPRVHSDEFINAINAKQSTWVAGRNFPEDTPIEQLRHLNGAIRGHSNRTKFRVHEIIPENIPESFDAREQWPQCESIKSIRNQGQCGSCWAFAAVEAMTDRLCIATNGAVKFEFSPEDLITCCYDCGYGCDGGYPLEAWYYYGAYGIVSGGDYDSQQGCKPYPAEAFQDGTTLSCEETCTNSNYGVDYNQDKHFGGEYYSIYGNVQQIQAEIMANGPVETSYEVYEDFYDYQSGVYQYTYGEYQGGHAVKIIGWGTENGTPYWLIANSWGADWGQLGGFFKILRGENHLYIEDEIDAGELKVL